MPGLSERFIGYLLLGLFLLVALAIVLTQAVLPRISTPEAGVVVNKNKLQVTASFYPLFYFASVIGGAHAQVYDVTPAGAEPHDYEPTTQDIARVEKGDMLILNGGIEAWGDKIRAELQGTSVKVVIAGEGLFTQQIVEEGQTAVDPHVWLNPLLAKREAARILDGFIAADPANRSDYEVQGGRLESQFDLLDAAFRNGLAHCRQSDFITSHSAFGYLAQAYGLDQVSISGLSPDAEPSARDLANVAKLAKSKKIKYIFFESLVSPRFSQTIADEIGAETLVLDPIEGLTDEQIRQGRTYFTVMEDNLVNLQTALECTP